MSFARRYEIQEQSVIYVFFVEVGEVFIFVVDNTSITVKMTSKKVFKIFVVNIDSSYGERFVWCKADFKKASIKFSVTKLSSIRWFRVGKSTFGIGCDFGVFL